MRGGGLALSPLPDFSEEGRTELSTNLSKIGFVFKSAFPKHHRLWFASGKILTDIM